MNLPELIHNQRRWEGERGIKNGHYGIDRVQVELDEAREATNLEEKLAELIDVQIILAGTFSRLCAELGVAPEQIPKMIDDKLKVNEIKYNLRYFKEWSPDEAQAYARYVWSFNPPEWGESEMY